MSVQKIEKNFITITIDGKECIGKNGDTILKIARANGIYIPTMCYLTKVEPIASCRMCVVEVDGIEGMILSCQEKAVEGAVVTTNSKELHNQRQNIMKLYNVNHPLECGVCDKSGECDLQNKTLEFNVSNQNFSTKESHKKVENWGYVSYDPALCIMCEKCVRVSNEITGNEALSVSVGGYKSKIVNIKNSNCSSLGESAAVCPVGALVNSDFKYSSNAWELKQVPASCMHCSSVCSLNYEVKNDKIYRVTNNYEFSSLCGLGRFGFDFENKNAKKDPVVFREAISAFKRAKSIRFSAVITNEEALILQKLKEKYKYNLVCDEAYGYQRFLNAYSSISGASLYSGDLNSIKDSDGIIVFGTRINDDNPMVKYHITMASKRKRARVAYFHPIEDSNLSNVITQFVKYEAGSEEGVVALLASVLLNDHKISDDLKSFLDNLDIGNLSAESSVGEEELDYLAKSIDKKQKLTFIVGSDLYNHPRAVQIAKILGAIEKYSDFSLVIVPPATNALGVSLICSLDEKTEGYTIGYNAIGDFELSSLGYGDMDMPALNQQEGTLTNIDKRVVPTNAALSYQGYVLNDISNELGFEAKYTIDYTSMLPAKAGYKTEDFDNLPDFFDNSGIEHRGYPLTSKSVKVVENFDEIEDLPTYDGAIIYHCNENTNISVFSNVTTAFKSNEFYLRGSPQFANIVKIKDGDDIKFNINGIKYQRVFKIDEGMKGTIAINPIFDMDLNKNQNISYRFNHLHREQ
jgi:NADH-quinone oxidoreductase subunit G